MDWWQCHRDIYLGNIPLEIAAPPGLQPLIHACLAPETRVGKVSTGRENFSQGRKDRGCCSAGDNNLRENEWEKNRKHTNWKNLSKLLLHLSINLLSTRASPMRKCESNFNTDMLFDWTGDFDFKREKKKMDEKTHQRQLFQGVGGCVEGGGGVEWV